MARFAILANMTYRTIAVVCGLLLLTTFAQAAKKGQVKLEEKDNHIAVSIDGKPFTDYYFATEGDRPFVRPFFYPVLAADGTEMTNDQLRSAGDHPHHRSLYVAHGDVNGADHWSLMQKPIPQQRHLKFNRLEGDTLVQELEWEGKGTEEGATAPPILHETRTIRFFALPDDSRGIDLTVELRALADSVTFGDTKEAGLCTVRVAKAISDTSTITNSAGQTGEAEAWGKPAAWCDISGKVDGKDYGVAILDHPDNPRHPTRWHVRGYGLMAANIFGLSDFDKAAPGTGALTIKKDDTLTFRYRVIIHPGTAAEAKLDEKFEEFKKQATADISE